LVPEETVHLVYLFPSAEVPAPGTPDGAGEGMRKVSLRKEISSSPSPRSCDGQLSTKGTLQGSGGVKKRMSSRKRKKVSGKEV